MKSVLISIKPYWVFLIIAQKMGWDIPQNKTVEIRKTYPKENSWNKKVIIYCTQDKKSFKRIPKEHRDLMRPLLGKVIGEFVCDKLTNIFALSRFWLDEEVLEKSCLSLKQIRDYCKGSDRLYGWYIFDLKIYDEPKELSKFNKPCDFNYDCFLCNRAVYDKKVITDISGKITKVNNKFIACDDVITRPPQSWCYVEELRDV